jgi:hypothetical protein
LGFVIGDTGSAIDSRFLFLPHVHHTILPEEETKARNGLAMTKRNIARGSQIALTDMSNMTFSLFDTFDAGEETSVVFNPSAFTIENEGQQETKKDDNSDNDKKNRTGDEVGDDDDEGGVLDKKVRGKSLFFFFRRNSSWHSTKPNTARIWQGRMSRRTMYDGRRGKLYRQLTLLC